MQYAFCANFYKVEENVFNETTTQHSKITGDGCCRLRSPDEEFICHWAQCSLQTCCTVTSTHVCTLLLHNRIEWRLLIVTKHFAILSLLFSCSPYFVFLHFCIFYYCDISCSCIWQLAFYRNEMNVTIDTGEIVICFVHRLYISECVWHLLLIKKWNENENESPVTLFCCITVLLHMREPQKWL